MFKNIEKHLLPSNLSINYEIEMGSITYLFKLPITFEDAKVLTEEIEQLKEADQNYSENKADEMRYYSNILTQLQYKSKKNLLAHVGYIF